MVTEKELSFIFKILRRMDFNYSEEEYGDVTIWNVIGIFYNIRLNFLEGMLDWSILDPIESRKRIHFTLRRMGCKVGKGCFVGDYVRVDTSHPDMITLEDNVSIASGSRLPCHPRDFSDYCVGDDYMRLGYTVKPVELKKGCLVGMESFVMPGVVIGEGAIVGAGPFASKDIPAWTIAAGRLAKVLTEIPNRDTLRRRGLTVQDSRVSNFKINLGCALDEERRVAA